MGLYDRHLRHVIRRTARDVANLFEFASDWHEIQSEDVGEYAEIGSDGDGGPVSSGRSISPVSRDDLEFAGWEAVRDYTGENFKYLRATLRRDMINEAEKLMRAGGWLHKDGLWTRKRVDAHEVKWLFGGRPDCFPQAEAAPSELVEKLRTEYPTLVAWVEAAESNERAAYVLGVSESTVSRRRAAEAAKLAEDTETLAAIERDRNTVWTVVEDGETFTFRRRWHAAPKRCSGPAYSAGTIAELQPVESYRLQGLDLPRARDRFEDLALARKAHASKTGGAPVALLGRPTITRTAAERFPGRSPLTGRSCAEIARKSP